MANVWKSHKKIIITILLVVLVVGGSAGGYVLYLYDQANSVVVESHEEVERENDMSVYREVEVDPVEDNVSVLFIGVDDSEHRSDRHSRSDALILATFNKNLNSVKLLTIPRDAYVHVPEVGYDTKINHAHAYGGARATIETVEAYLELPVDYYVRMNFNAFVDVVDALGGIYFDVPFEMLESDSDDKRDTIHLMPGYQHLDGEETLALTRTRKYDSDIARGKRQQEVIQTIADTASSASSLFRLDDVLQAVGNNMTSNLTMPEIRGFLAYGLRDDMEMNSINFDGTGGYAENGIWYYFVEEDSKLDIQQRMRDHLELEPAEQDPQQDNSFISERTSSF